MQRTEIKAETLKVSPNDQIQDNRSNIIYI